MDNESRHYFESWLLSLGIPSISFSRNEDGGYSDPYINLLWERGLCIAGHSKSSELSDNATHEAVVDAQRQISQARCHISRVMDNLKYNSELSGSDKNEDA